MDNCSYGKVTRNMVENLNNDFKEFRTEIREEFHSLKEVNTRLYNHLSNRLPLWATSLGIFGTAIIAALIGRVLW